MKNLIMFSLLLASAVFAQWPGFILNDPGSPNDTSMDTIDSTDEYQDPDASDSLGICWKQSYARYGRPLVNSCLEGLVKIGAYCYHPCKEGYTDGYFSGLSTETDQDPEEFETTSDVESYCWGECPKGYEEVYFGGDCMKGDEMITRKSYNRTYVQPLDCPKGLVFDSGLCYAPPKEGFRCNKALCYGECPKGWGLCGALCAKLGLCKGEIMFEGVDVDQALKGLAAGIKHPSQENLINATAVPGVLNGTQYPFCH